MLQTSPGEVRTGWAQDVWWDSWCWGCSITHGGLRDAASTSLTRLGGSASFKPLLTLQFKVQPQCCTLPPPPSPASD